MLGQLTAGAVPEFGAVMDYDQLASIARAAKTCADRPWLIRNTKKFSDGPFSPRLSPSNRKLFAYRVMRMSLVHERLTGRTRVERHAMPDGTFSLDRRRNSFHSPGLG
jgi:hypothetical protein